MARRQPNRRLAALLAEAGWGPAQLAREVNGLGRAQGLTLSYDRTAVAHWLTGSRPRPPVPELVASAFSGRGGRLVTAEETGLTKARQAADDPLLPHRSGAGDTVDRLVALCRADADPVSRAGVTGSAYTLADLTALDWRPKRLPAVRSAGPSRQVTREDIQQLFRMVQVFVDLMEFHGGAHGRSALVAYLADDASPLLVAPGPPALRRELLTGAGQLAHVVARMSMDAGHARLAQSYFTITLDLAGEADDRRLHAVTLRAMSIQALSLGFRKRAAHLADVAVDTAGPDADPSTQAFLLSQRAVTHAYARRRREAVSDLATAQAQHDRADGGTGPFTRYPRPGLDYQRGRALLALGEPAQAVHALTTAADARPEERHRSSALTRARLAGTLLTLGRLEEACIQWQVFLDHYPMLHAAPADQALRQLRTSLRGFHRQPHAAAVLRRARSVSRPAPPG